MKKLKRTNKKTDHVKHSWPDGFEGGKKVRIKVFLFQSVNFIFILSFLLHILWQKFLPNDFSIGPLFNMINVRYHVMITWKLRARK